MSNKKGVICTSPEPISIAFIERIVHPKEVLYDLTPEQMKRLVEGSVWFEYVGEGDVHVSPLPQVSDGEILGWEENLFQIGRQPVKSEKAIPNPLAKRKR